MVYGLVALRGPQGVSALLDKRREVRQLEEQNAAQAAENERRRERIHRLEQNSTEQEMEIRKQLKLLRPGETTFILEDRSQGGGSARRTAEPALAKRKDVPGVRPWRFENPLGVAYFETALRSGPA